MDKQDRREAVAAYKARRSVGGVYQIRNTETGRVMLTRATDLRGSENRFRFAQMTDTCVDYALQADWKQYGKDVFVFETLESLEQTETQTAAEFAEDIETLYELWCERVTAPRYGT